MEPYGLIDFFGTEADYYEDWIKFSIIVLLRNYRKLHQDLSVPPEYVSSKES